MYYFIVESVLKKIYILHTCIIGQLPSVDLRFLKCSKNSRSEDYYSMIFSLVWFGSVNDAKASVFGYLVLIRFGPPQLSDIIWYLNAMTWVWFFSIQTLMCTHVMVIKPTPFRDYMSPPQTPLRAYCCYSIPLWKMVDFDKAELSNHGALFCPCTIWALLEAMISLIPASRFLLWGLWISWEKYLPP